MFTYEDFCGYSDYKDLMAHFNIDVYKERTKAFEKLADLAYYMEDEKHEKVLDLCYLFFADVNRDDPAFQEFSAILSKRFGDRLPKGGLIGYKKACIEHRDYAILISPAKRVIVKLRIPEDALRSKAFYKKCRCNKAFVEDIYTLPESTTTTVYYGQSVVHLSEAFSCRNPLFKYQVGQMVEVKDFDTCPWVECSTGIHFFENEEDAINYII